LAVADTVPKAKDPIETVLKAPHFSTKGVGPFIRYLDQREGSDVVDGALADAGLPREHVMAEDLWVSLEWQSRFQRALAGRLFKLAELPAHDHPFWRLWREGAHATVSREALGALYYVVRALGSPGLSYRRFPALMAAYNRITDLSIETIGPRHLRLVFTPLEADGTIGSDLYWNILGLMERVPAIRDLPDAQVEVEESPFHPTRPAQRLVMSVRYEDPETSRWWTRSAAGALGVVLGGLPGMLGGDVTMTISGALTGLGLAWWLLELRWRRAVEAEIADEGRQMHALISAQDARYRELWEEERKLRRSLLASQKLSGYLPTDLVDEILENPEMETTLGGRRTYAAVLFADLVGFTPRTEKRDPETVVEELNLYFGYIDPAFQTHGGVIDKRMGDGVMAVFVPWKDEEPMSVRLRAVRCGLDLLRAVEACNAELESRGTEPLAARVGIAAGPLVQGTMGSSVKFEYTVIGDVVNTAARLEGQARPHHLVVGADIFDSVVDGGVIPGRVVDRRMVRVKGKQEAIEVVELVPVADGP